MSLSPNRTANINQLTLLSTSDLSLQLTPVFQRKDYAYNSIVFLIISIHSNKEKYSKSR